MNIFLKLLKTILLVTFILGVAYGVFYFFESKKTSKTMDTFLNNSKNQSYKCPESAYLESNFTSLLNKNYNFSKDKYELSPFILRVQDVTPYVWMDSEESNYFSINAEKPDVKNILQNDLISSVETKGFSTFQPILLKDSEEEYAVGLKKDDFYYFFEVKDVEMINDSEIQNKIISKGTPQTTVLYYCGRENQETIKLAKLYDKILKSNDPDSLNEDMIIGVGEYDGVLGVNIGSIYGTGGSARYWDIKSTPPVLFYAGQEAPLCEDLETRKIGKGLGCQDQGQYRIADY